MNIKKLAARATALILAAACISGCAGSTPAAAAAYNGGEIPAGVYIFHQVNSLNEAYSKLSNPYASADEFFKQEIEGVSAEQWVNDRTEKYLKAYAAVESESARLGLTVDEATVSAMDQQLTSTWKTEGAQMEAMGISLSSAKAVAKNNQLSALLFQAYYGEGGEKAVPASELEQFFADNYRRSLMLILSLKNTASGEALDEAKVAEVKKLYESYKARVTAGETVFAVLQDEEKRLRAEANDTSAYNMTEASQELLVAKKSTSYPEALRDKIFSVTELNAPQFYEDENYLIIFDVRELMGDGTAFNNAKASLLTSYKNAEYTDTLLALSDSIGFNLNSDAVKSFKVKTIIDASR